MTVMYSFCLWFPLRLGAMICGFSAAAQSLACLIACIVGDSNREDTSQKINGWLKFTDFLVATELFKALSDDPATVLGWFIGALTIHLLSCALLTFGVYRCSLSFMYPFVGLDFIRMIIVSVLFILLILIIKINTNTLGYVISCSIGGGFLLLYLWYQWFCVVSLCQIIRHVEKMDSLLKRPHVNLNGTKKPDLSRLEISNYGRMQDVTLYSKNSPFYGLPKIT